MKHFFMAILILLPLTVFSQNRLIIQADSGQHTISRHIYGQFSEHLGRGVYEGIWVGENSHIPNTRGIRNDVVEALRRLNIPNLRWPGGCFADEYHWRDGIGDPAQRPEMINTHWGGVVEDNSFGTHEFLDLCRQLDTEPYITANVGSGTVEEMSKWVEYLTFDGKSPMTELRRENGRDAPWKIRYWGVGNENWGCGGHMRAEYYADLYNRFATYCRNYGDNKLYKIAGGSYQDDYNWTEVLLKNVKHHLMDGISIHYYTINLDWGDKVSATDFDEGSWFEVIEKASRMDLYLSKHIALMDKYDPDNNIGVIVDEWGAWHAEEPGTKSGFLYQQNTLRDAFVAAITLNIFHAHARRVHMANIAQTINVLQAMILTDKENMLLTPTYHVFDMFKVHQDALFLPSLLQAQKYRINGKEIPALHASASQDKNGFIHLSVANINPREAQHLNCKVAGASPKFVSGRILTADRINSYNSFEEPNLVSSGDFSAVRRENSELVVNIPPKSIVVLKLRL